MNETACVSYTAADDVIKEDTEQLTLRLISHDDFVCLCRDFGIISVYEDATDGKHACHYHIHSIIFIFALAVSVYIYFSNIPFVFQVFFQIGLVSQSSY